MPTKMNMSQRRSNLEIIAEILRLARKGTKKTRIVYRANLNFKMLEDYLARLEKMGLVSQTDEKRHLIRTTKKGKEYLQRFRGLKELGVNIKL
jgi:predicted transcriptional regulator